MQNLQGMQARNTVAPTSNFAAFSVAYRKPLAEQDGSCAISALAFSIS
jgi:hypothetical protein